MHLKNQAPLFFSLRTRSALGTQFVQARIFFKFFSNSFQIYFKFACKIIYFFIFFTNSFQFVSKNLYHFSICFQFPLQWSEICRWSFKWNKTHVFVGLNKCFLKVLPTSKFWGQNFHFFLATLAWNKKKSGRIFNKACYL